MNFVEILKIPLVKDSLTIVLMGIGIYFLWGKISQVEAQNEACQQEFRRMLMDQISKSNQVIEANTEAFRGFRDGRK